MFKHLTDFSYKRSGKEAFGFYLAYFLIGLILGAIAGGLSGIGSGGTTFDQGYNSAFGAGVMVGIIYSVIIALVVLGQRKLYKSFGYIVLALLSGVLAIFGGALFGLIIPAFMTTRGIAEEVPPTVA